MKLWKVTDSFFGRGAEKNYYFDSRSAADCYAATFADPAVSVSYAGNFSQDKADTLLEESKIRIEAREDRIKDWGEDWT